MCDRKREIVTPILLQKILGGGFTGLFYICFYALFLFSDDSHFGFLQQNTAIPTKRRRDAAEEGVKDKLILEMRAEITRLRANVMTAHEKIRTLEQIHAQDEERITQLEQELLVYQPNLVVSNTNTCTAQSDVMDCDENTTCDTPKPIMDTTNNDKSATTEVMAQITADV